MLSCGNIIILKTFEKRHSLEIKVVRLVGKLSVPVSNKFKKKN